MKIAVVFIYPFNGRDGRKPYGERFISTYLQFPGGEDHRLVVVSNGEPPNDETKAMFSQIPHTDFLVHDDSGWDIGGYQHAADQVDCDLMVFFGGNTYLRRPGWLKRMREVFDLYGNILYGSMQVCAAIQIGIWAHVRTTGFWMSPKLMKLYPTRVTHPSQRYPFEHGPDSLTMWCAKNYGCGVATFDNFYWMDKWTGVVEGFHWGQQKELLVGDRMTCPPAYPYA